MAKNNDDIDSGNPLNKGEGGGEYPVTPPTNPVIPSSPPPSTGGDTGGVSPGGEQKLPRPPYSPGGQQKLPSPVSKPNGPVEPNPAKPSGKHRGVINPAPVVPVIPPAPDPGNGDPGPLPPLGGRPFTPDVAKDYERVLTYNAKGAFETLIYGEVHDVGAAIAFWKFTVRGGLLIRYIIGKGPIESIFNIRIQDNPITSYPSMHEFPAGTLFDDTWGGTSGYHVRLGTSSQPVSAITSFHRSTDGWVATNNPGVADVIVHFPAYPYPNNPFESPGDRDAFYPDITDFKCDVKGLKIRNPILDPTLVNKYFSENPALIVADIFTNLRYGGRLHDSKINWALLASETAPFCDEDIGGGKKRYTVGFVVQKQQLLEELVDNVCQHAQLFWRFNNGKINIIADKPRASTGVTITDDDLIGNTVIETAGKGEVPNRTNVHFTNKDNGWKQDVHEVPTPELTGVAVELNVHDWELYGTRDRDQANRIGIYHHNRAIRDKMYRFQTMEIGTALLPGDRFTFTDSDLNIAGIELVVNDCQKIEGGGWDFACEVYDEGIYANTITTNFIVPTLVHQYVPEPPSKIEFLAGTAPPPVRQKLFPVLTHNNASLFDATKLQNGNRNEHALQFNNSNLAGTSWVRAHFAAATALREVIVWFDPAYIDSEEFPFFDFQYSTNNGASWNNIFIEYENGILNPMPSVGRPQYSGIFSSALGNITDIRLILPAVNAKQGFINDIEFFSYTGELYTTAAGYRIRTYYGQTTNGVGQGGFTEYDIYYSPDSTNPIPQGYEWIETIVGFEDPVYGIGSLRVNFHEFIEVATISHSGVISDFRPLYRNFHAALSDVAGPPDGLAQSWIPQNQVGAPAAPYVIGLATVDLPITLYDGVIPITSTTSSSVLHGITNGFLGRNIRLKNVGGFNINIPNESGTEALTYNRIVNRGYGNLILRPGDLLELNYVTTPYGDRWDSSTSTLPWAFITGNPATYPSDWSTLASKPAWTSAILNQSGSYGTLNLVPTAGYIGIKYNGTHTQFMMDAGGNWGIHDETGGVWHWYVAGGSLSIGSVPWANISGIPAQITQIAAPITFGGARFTTATNGWFGIELGTTGTNNICLMWSGSATNGLGTWGLLQNNNTWLWYVVNGQLQLGTVPPHRVNASGYDRTNWGSGNAIFVAREIGWNVYGNSHTIVDNSSGAYGGAWNNASNPFDDTGAAFQGPVLMGYNGGGTYGVKVDRARYAEQLITGATGVTPATGDNTTKVPTTAWVLANAGIPGAVVLTGTSSGSWTIVSGGIDHGFITVTGAAVGDVVAVSHNGLAAVGGEWIISGYVSAANQVRVVFYNGTGSTQTISGTIRATVFHY